MAGEQGQPGAKGSPGADSRDNLASAARDSGERVMGQAQDRAESGKNRAADGMDHATDAVRSAAEQLQDQEPWMADLLSRGADELAQLSDALRTNDMRTLLSRAESLSRQQPMLVAGAAFAAGFAAMRATRAGMNSASHSVSEMAGNAMDTARREAGNVMESARKDGDGGTRSGSGFQTETRSGRSSLEH